MRSQAVRERMDSAVFESVDREELLRAVGSLRRELNAMASDIRSVIGENAALKRELRELREHRGSGQSVSEMRRAKEELDHLIHLHELVSGGRAQSRQTICPQQPTANCVGDRSAWTKKMMMLMMMAELM